MSPERGHAYRRVLQLLDELGPSKLHGEEQDRIRHAADNLIFSRNLADDAPARDSLDDVGRLCRELVGSGRWEQVAARGLADGISECGPARFVELEAA